MTTQARCDPRAGRPRWWAAPSRPWSGPVRPAACPEESAPRISHSRRSGDLLGHGRCCADAHTHLPDVCHDQLRVGTSCSKCNHGQSDRPTPPDSSRRPAHRPRDGPRGGRGLRTAHGSTARKAKHHANRLTELLGIEHPVMSAGMGGVSYSELAAAVSEAGGLGCLGGVHHGRREDGGRDRRRAPRHRQALRGRPPHRDAGRHDRAGEDDHRRRCVGLRGGARGPDRGRRPLPQPRRGRRQHVRQGRARVRAVDAGCDLVVAQGTEAGGHTGQVATSRWCPRSSTRSATVCRSWPPGASSTVAASPPRWRSAPTDLGGDPLHRDARGAGRPRVQGQAADQSGGSDHRQPRLFGEDDACGAKHSTPTTTTATPRS